MSWATGGGEQGVTQAAPSPEDIRASRLARLDAQQETPDKNVATEYATPVQQQTEAPRETAKIVSKAEAMIPMKRATATPPKKKEKTPMKKENVVDKVYRKIFRVTLNAAHSKHKFEFLAEFAVADGEEAQLISDDTISEVVYTRLAMERSMLKADNPSASIIEYLITCYKNAGELGSEEAVRKTEGGPECVKNAKQICINYMSTALIEPNMFPCPGDIKEVVEALNAVENGKRLPNGLFAELVAALAEQDMAGPLLAPILQGELATVSRLASTTPTPAAPAGMEMMMQQLMAGRPSQVPSLLAPFIDPLVVLVKLCESSKAVANSFANLEENSINPGNQGANGAGFLPPTLLAPGAVNGAVFEQRTALGLLLRLGSISTSAMPSMPIGVVHHSDVGPLFENMMQVQLLPSLTSPASLAFASLTHSLHHTHSLHRGISSAEAEARGHPELDDHDPQQWTAAAGSSVEAAAHTAQGG
jgi:hypothetical protein